MPQIAEQDRDPGYPTPFDALALAERLLAGEGTRLAHVRSAGFVAHQLGGLFEPADAVLLEAAATVHDIGYSPAAHRTGFHPLDGGLHLRDAGFPQRLAALVAHHSLAHLMTAEHDGGEFPFEREQSLLADALVYSDMHSAPDGRIIRGEARLADIAARRPTQVELRRADGLREAMARVGAAILAAGPDVVPAPDATPAFRQWWIQEARRCVAAAGAARTETAAGRLSA